MRFSYKNIILFLSIVYLWPYYTVASEQQISPDKQAYQTGLCDMPRDIIQHIMSFLPYVSIWVMEDLHALRRSCKFLHDTATVPGVVIRISCCKRGENSVKNHLQTAFSFIQSVAKRQGNNPIHIFLNAVDLGTDQDSLKEFLQKCSVPPIAPHIKHLTLEYNDLTSLPPEIANFTELEFLSLECNKLKRKDLELAIQLPNLKEIYFRQNQLTEADADYLKKKYPSLNNLLVRAIKEATIN
jgi:hypothetical protein